LALRARYAFLRGVGTGHRGGVGVEVVRAPVTTVFFDCLGFFASRLLRW
jgi:hypothetical protein